MKVDENGSGGGDGNIIGGIGAMGGGNRVGGSGGGNVSAIISKL